ncbi:hypothetical protein [Desulfurispira natronophila]|uniref:Flagellar hook-length control protein FliK n=1 Tax=Desulfurispira natronophila TaxID=682562 RepID=A0A7W7Y464_9BACT|nr:hypothetical protein [Desulfurispira natronophila]MBB5021740.1 hypothetical protein [Desulfurispira natronophila]
MDAPTLLRQVENLQRVHDVRLTTGQKLDVIVRSTRNSAEVSLLMQGRQVSAQTEAKLEPGRYQVQVQSTTPTLVLRLMPPPIPGTLSTIPHTGTPSSLVTSLSQHPLAPVLQMPSSAQIQQIFSQSAELLPQIQSSLAGNQLSTESLLSMLRTSSLNYTSPSSLGTGSQQAMAAQMQHLAHFSGIMMEQLMLAGNQSVVKDLKFQLLQLASRYAGNERLVQAVRNYVQFLTKEQVANLILNQDGIYLVDIPLDDLDKLRRLRMRLQKRKKNSKGIDSDILSLYMEFSHLGPIKVNCFQSSPTIQLVLFSNEKAVVTQLQQGAADLQGAVEALTKCPARIAVRYSEEVLFRDFDENLVLIRAIKEWEDEDEKS